MLARPRPRPNAPPEAVSVSGGPTKPRAAGSPLPKHALFGQTGRKDPVENNKITRTEKKVPLDKEMLETILQEVRGLTDDELYEQLSTWQDNPELLVRRQQTELQLHSEVEKLQEEVQHHRQGCAAAQQLALDAQVSHAEATRRSEFQLGLVKRQLQSIKRGTTAEAEQEALHLADQLSSLEQQQARSALARSSIREKEAASKAAAGETAQLLSERTELQQRLRKTREMLELQQLLTDERMLLEKRKMSSGEMLREIADLEEQADDVERNGQRVVADMRGTLEKLAQRIESLKKAKDQAEDWLGAVWAALNQQRREQLLLHRRVKEEDNWATRLQERTDALVDELGILERQVTQPSSASQGQEEALRTVALMQQRRKVLKKDLSTQLALSRQVHGKLKDAEGTQTLLLEQLRPLQPMLRTEG